MKSVESQRMLFGHPTGLFTLFFAEMWERFSYYGMRALLVFYMTKGFLRYSDKDAIAVYTAYTSLVYMTPFFGGMLADRLLGARRAVVLGGLLMAAGHLLMGYPRSISFFVALALLIVGNGFFKPNISTIVGTLYPSGSTKRDGGFTIFYMGINLGAAMSPLLCGYVGETFGWHWGFGLATIGMLVGLAVFVAPTWLTQLLILIGAAAAGFGLVWFHPSSFLATLVNVFVACALLAAGVISFMALGRGGLPREAGAPPRDAPPGEIPGFGMRDLIVYSGVFAVIVLFSLLVSGFAPLSADHRGIKVIPESVIEGLKGSSIGFVKNVVAMVVEEASRPAGLVLLVAGLVAFGFVGFETTRLDRVARERMQVVLILTFFSMLFWAFFEQAGSSVNLFTDRNIDRVLETRHVTEQDVGQTIELQPTQEQLGYANGDAPFTLDQLQAARDENSQSPDFTIPWEVSKENVGMGIATRSQEIPASIFQAVNPVCIITLGLVFTALWTYLGAKGLEPNTAIKFALGLIQLGLGFGSFWYGAKVASDRGMVAAGWLVLGYVLHTTGELCISPVGLSMVTRLSPARLVSTVMGMWFLATAFSQYLAGIIAQFTGVEEVGGGGSGAIPVPKDTVGAYGTVFGNCAMAAVAAGIVCLLISPILNRWMHAELEKPPTV